MDVAYLGEPIAGVLCFRFTLNYTQLSGCHDFEPY